ncbi:hypothetical protein HYR69_10050 [Candidatus Sumerlaeota bacterium]|nr:hypothetical protein [Candidatus Sumerlaeota bacterium]
MHFENASRVHNTLNCVAGKLEELGIPYAIAGAMALFHHGYRRFTEDVDILVTREGLKKLYEALESLGSAPPFSDGKNLRDTESGVKIDFMVTGDYPGDGMPKPVAFPDPDDVAQTIKGHRFIPLAKLFELKLASGLTNPLRAKDIGDVQEAVKVLRPPLSLADEMNPFVRDNYIEIWHLVHDNLPDDY